MKNLLFKQILYYVKIYMVINMNKPLSILLRPKSIKDVVGQDHLVGKNGILRKSIENNFLFSMILYGASGIGKTSIAYALANDSGFNYKILNAVNCSKKDIDILIEEAKLFDNYILILDEIHRLNKDKQDILLPEIENGSLILIGITTENPYHSINSAIRSRCQLFELNDLTSKDILFGIKNALSSEFLKGINITDEAISTIVTLSGNDLRYAYNLLEVLYKTNDGLIDSEYVLSVSNKPVFFSNKSGDFHFDLLSAFQKSIRGSDVDASLHYLGRLIFEGDLKSIYRRLSVIAYEDIGLANPNIGVFLDAAIASSERVGLPEARIILSEIVILMALSPKSNTACNAINAVFEDIEKGNVGKIPNHIKNTSKLYKYPFDYKGNFVIQDYLPNNIKNKKYYVPSTFGYENSIKEIYDKINKLKSQK